MKRFFQTLKNIWKIEELRKRILYTLALLAVYRLGCFVVIPGIDASPPYIALGIQRSSPIMMASALGSSADCARNVAKFTRL